MTKALLSPADLLVLLKQWANGQLPRLLAYLAGYLRLQWLSPLLLCCEDVARILAAPNSPCPCVSFSLRSLIRVIHEVVTPRQQAQVSCWVNWWQVRWHVVLWASLANWHPVEFKLSEFKNERVWERVERFGFAVSELLET